MSGFDINQLTISGNLTSDPELRTLATGTAVCRIRIAHNERRRLESGEWIDQPQFFDVTLWAGIGEWVTRNIARGDRVVIAGRLRWREWETDSGERRQAVDISADSIIPTPRSTTDATPGPATAEDDIPF